jgi:hypothetical protein
VAGIVQIVYRWAWPGPSRREKAIVFPSGEMDVLMVFVSPVKINTSDVSLAKPGTPFRYSFRSLREKKISSPNGDQLGS